MSLAAIRPLFRARMNALGFKEHKDAFDDTNRSQKQLEKLYRINTSTATGAGSNQTVHQFDQDVELVITLRGKGDKNVALVDRAWGVADDVLADILSPSVRMGTTVKLIVPATITVEELSADNDNDVTLTMGFTASIICNFT